MVLVITGVDGGVHNVNPSHLLLPENINHLKGSISIFPPVSSFNPDYSFLLILKPLHLITLLLPFLVPLPPFPYPFIHPLCCFSIPIHPSTLLLPFCLSLPCIPQFITPSALFHRSFSSLSAFNLFNFFVSLPLLSLPLTNLSRCVLFYLSPWRYPPSVY